MKLIVAIVSTALVCLQPANGFATTKVNQKIATKFYEILLNQIFLLFFSGRCEIYDAYGVHGFGSHDCTRNAHGATKDW